MTGNRTTERWMRAYMGGYDVSGYGRSAGPLEWKYDEAEFAGWGDAVKGRLPTWCEITPTALNAYFDHTTNGLHDISKAAGLPWVTSFLVGMNAEPVQGDEVYCGRFQQLGYQAQEDGGAITVTLPFVGADASNQIGYDKPWGNLLHVLGAETAANTAIGVDGLAASAFGGYMVYHVIGGDGTATIKVQKSTTTNLNASFSDLSGATSGVIDCSSPTSGIIPLSHTLSIGQFLRWQLALGTATTVTFALIFVRANH